MRVRHIVRQYEPSVGGLETFVHKLAHSLNDLGCESDVLTLNRILAGGTQRLPMRERVNGIDVERVPMVGHRRLFAPVIPASALRGYDVLHVHGIDGMFERVARQPRDRAQLRVATSHGLFFHTPWMAGVKKLYFSTITRLAASRYDCLIGNSAADEERLLTLGPPVVQIPNGVAPLGDFTAGGRDLLCLGRLSSHKRVDRLIAMMALPPLDGVTLHIVGPTWDVPIDSLRAQTQALGITERVQIHGHVAPATLAAIAARCGLIVSASEYEGFGMSLIEAMSVGLIPVVEPNLSFRQLIGNASVGALISFQNPANAAIGVAAILARIDPEMRQRARAVATVYSWARNAAATTTLYAALREQRQTLS